MIWSVKWLVAIKNYLINGDNARPVTYEVIKKKVMYSEAKKTLTTNMLLNRDLLFGKTVSSSMA